MPRPLSTQRGRCAAVVDSFASFAKRMEVLNRELSPEATDQIAKRVGLAARVDARDAVKADHDGRDYFSGWPKAKFTTAVSPDASGRVLVGPKSKGVGVWKVAEYGRHPGLGGGSYAGLSGPALGGFSKRTGKILKGRRRKKWNGTTDPQNTWSEAETIIARETPKRVRKAVDAAQRRAGV